MFKYIVYVAALVLLSGCYPNAMGSSAEGKATSKSGETKAVGINAKTVCFDGIVYFTVWNNNAFSAPYITGVKIDPKTLKPQICVK